MSKPPKQKTRADLEREIIELKAQMASNYHFAAQYLYKYGTERFIGSGVLLRLHALGGAEIIPPIVIRDGLSNETINALRNDIQRSFDLAVMFKPEMVGKK